jgi:hypothetical protein
VATIIARLRPDVPAVAILDWEQGKWIGLPDEELLKAANAKGLTLVTYDQRTIPRLLQSWAQTGERHAGVVFVDERTILPNDLPSLARSLIRAWDEYKDWDWDWSNRLTFLRAVHSEVAR